MTDRSRRAAPCFAFLLASLGFASLASADDEARFRSICEEDAPAEKCACYLDRLRDSLSPSDYHTLISYEVTSSERKRDQRKVIGRRGPSDEEIASLRARTEWAVDDGLFHCELDYNE